jgi:putative SOS response-associated peptidase YedK
LCNLYSLTKVPEAVRRLFRVSSNRAATYESRDAIFRGHAAPVVRRTEDGDRELVELSCGFVLPEPGKEPKRVTTARHSILNSPNSCD